MNELVGDAEADVSASRLVMAPLSDKRTGAVKKAETGRPNPLTN